MLDEAHDLLLEGATAKLEVLAGGAYSLAIDERRQFLVIDHANADTERLARTLSGGETFLVSLALALALADQVAGLAAGAQCTSSRSSSTRASAASTPTPSRPWPPPSRSWGPRVGWSGVITHVRDLAERLPVRFEVRKGPATSTVERVSQ